MKQATHRRLDRLERHRSDEQPTTFVVLEPGDLAADLVLTWGDIDAGTFAGDEYHRRGLETLRGALLKMREPCGLD